MLLYEQIWPGTIATVQLTMIALVVTGFLTLVFFPLISPLMLGRAARTGGHVFLVVVRSTPEYILAFVLLNLWGPSMLPAIVALSLHNAAIIGHLVGRFTETIQLRLDAVNRVTKESTSPFHIYCVLVLRPAAQFNALTSKICVRQLGDGNA